MTPFHIELLVSTKGRISRKRFAMVFILLLLVANVLAANMSTASVLELIGSGSDPVNWAALLWKVLPVSLPLLYVCVCVAAQRMHDLGRSGWWQLFLYIPIIGFFAAAYMFSADGQTQANQYGEPVL